MIKNTVVMNMEHGIHEMVVLNHDGSYTIFLNARDNFETQKHSYIHALSHIINGDFEKADVQEIEYEAHRKGDYF